MPKIGKGQTIGIGTVGESPEFTALAKVRDVGGPSTTVDSIETTHSGSTHVERMPGFQDNGELTAGLVYEPAQTTTLRGYLGTTKAFKWTMSDGGFYTFNGFISALGKTSPYKDLITQDMTVAIDGPVTYTSPA